MPIFQREKEAGQWRGEKGGKKKKRMHETSVAAPEYHGKKKKGGLPIQRPKGEKRGKGKSTAGSLKKKTGGRNSFPDPLCDESCRGGGGEKERGGEEGRFSAGHKSAWPVGREGGREDV